MKKIFTGLLIAILSMAIATPVLAADPIVKGVEPKIGTKVVLDKNTEAVYQGKDAKGEHIYTATISNLPVYIDDLKTKIDPCWYYSSGKWVAGANLFEATVDAMGTTVVITSGKESMTLDPVIKIDNVAVKPISRVPMIVADYYNPNYSGNTLEWDYGIFKRQIRVIEGCIFQYLIFDSNPHGDVNIDSPVKTAGFTWDRPVEAWDYYGQPIEVAGNLVYASEFNREDIVYPIVIDPSPTFTTSASDGYLYKTDTDYDDAWNASTGTVYNTGTVFGIGQGFFDPNFRIYRAGLFFNTSALPDDCTIDSATVKLYGNADGSTTNFNIQVQSGMPTYPHDPMVTGDYDEGHYADNGGTLTTVGFTTSGYNTITLSATGEGWINKSGTTKFAIRSDREIANNQPGVAEYVNVYSYEQGAGKQPYLTVTYTVIAPTITTDAASNIANTSARLNSTVVDNGGEACEVRWGYGKTSEAAIADYDTFTAYAGSYATGEHPYLDIGSLDPNTTYYFRVEAQNSEGDDLGGELQFDTLNAIADVTDLRAIPQSSSVSLSWTKPSGATNTTVRYALDDFPPTEADGIEVYFSTGNNVTHTALTAGITYYYAAWGESGGTYSTNPDTVAITTLPVGAASEDLPEAAMPTGWYQAPDYTNLSNLGIFYMAGNGLADDLGMPRATAWVVFMIILSAVTAFLLYWRTHNPFAAIGGSSVVMVIGFYQEIVPLWIMIIAIVTGVGIILARRQTE